MAVPDAATFTVAIPVALSSTFKVSETSLYRGYAAFTPDSYTSKLLVQLINEILLLPVTGTAPTNDVESDKRLGLLSITVCIRSTWLVVKVLITMSSE